MSRKSVDTGTDYLSSLFRLHHYVGLLDSYVERSSDYRARRTPESYYKTLRKWQDTFYKGKPPLMDEDVDLLPWLQRFVDKVGMDKANQLLAYPKGL